jgi:hypothetical protein
MDARSLHLRSVGRTATREEVGSAVAAAIAIAELRDALRSFWRRF